MTNATNTDAELATATQQLLARATLQGAEVPDFVRIHNWLEAIRSGALAIVTPGDEDTQSDDISPDQG